MNKVLFLDFDGPLFPERANVFHTNKFPVPKEITEVDIKGIISYWKMDPIAVTMLNSLMELHQFDTVVSSSWRIVVDKPSILALFKANNLNLELHKDWETRSITGGRGVEIKDWLGRHPEYKNRYVILDDPWSGGDVEDGLFKQEQIVLVDPHNGIDFFSFKQLIEAMANWYK